VDKVRHRRRSPRGRARRGGLYLTTVGSHRRQGQVAQVDRGRGAVAEERGVRLGLTLTTPPSHHPPLYLATTDPFHRLGLGGRMGRWLGHSYEAWPEPRALQGNRPTNVCSIFLFTYSLNLI
jgi:hypothetical protein